VDEIAFVRARADQMGQIVRMIADGALPLRVTHNDTKCNNVMVDNDTGEALCVVDLDTVMAGSALYDYGDAIRFGASTAVPGITGISKLRDS
jgi:Ser/Thr protein kinase RdoA (MazF antagonist)